MLIHTYLMNLFNILLKYKAITFIRQLWMLIAMLLFLWRLYSRRRKNKNFQNTRLIVEGLQKKPWSLLISNHTQQGDPAGSSNSPVARDPNDRVSYSDFDSYPWLNLRSLLLTEYIFATTTLNNNPRRFESNCNKLGILLTCSKSTVLLTAEEAELTEMSTLLIEQE